jgi:biopolymer transport protein ExbD
VRFQRSVRQDIDLNMTPLIDVIFLLLIFFMVSTTFTKESRLGLTLPQAEIGENSVQVAPVVEVFIDATGVFKVDDVVLINNDIDSLKQALLMRLQTIQDQLKSTDTQPRLTITADAATAHQYVVTTMDIAGQLGFSQLSITTLKKESL